MTEKMEKQLGAILRKYNREEGNVISILQDLQKKYDHVSREAVYWFSDRLNIPASTFFGVATFYSQFHLKPRGRHIITACLGTACHVRGAVPVEHRIREHLSLGKGEDTTKDMHYTVESIACMGACSLAPVIKIDKKIHSNVLPEEVEHILEEDRGIKKR
jgi:NADH:ubiquinone oxidoreductase subunit E